MESTFSMTGRTYRTDAATLAVLRSIIPGAVKSGDYSAVAAVMAIGLARGRIVET